MQTGPDDWRSAARRALPRFVFDFVDGGADAEAALDRNARDFEALTLLPRVLVDTRAMDTSIELFGRRWSRPFGITPTGFNGLVRPGGDIMLARAAQGAGVPFVVATPSNERFEAVRRVAPEAMLWLQLYVMQDRSIAEQMIRRATALKFEALVLTVDVPIGGRRERDLRHGLRLPPRWTPRLAWDLAMHPRWSLSQALAGLPRFANLVENETGPVDPSAQSALPLTRSMDRTLVWSDVAWLRRQWRGPLVIKGLLHPDDARKAVEAGADAVTVSNHGGRQLDAAPSSISALPAIVDAVRGRVPVFVDSGLRRGSDVAKALALGARAAFFGRPMLWALACGGENGVVSALAQLGEQLESTMVLLGAQDIAALSRSQRGLRGGLTPSTCPEAGRSESEVP